MPLKNLYIYTFSKLDEQPNSPILAFHHTTLIARMENCGTIVSKRGFEFFIQSNFSI